MPYFFSKEGFPYITGNGNPEKNSLYFRKQNLVKTFRAQKIKGTHS